MKKILREFNVSGNSSILIKEEIANQFAAPFHFHHGYEFTYIIKGHGKFYGADRLMNFAEGELYLFGIGFPHYFINDKTFIETREKAHSIAIQFGEDFLGHDFYLKPEFKVIKELLRAAHFGLKIGKPSTVMKELVLDMPNQSGLKALISLLQLLELTSALNEPELTAIGSDVYKTSLNAMEENNKLEPVYQYVMQNFKEDLSTQKAASLAHMNPSAFCRYFKRRTNKTLSQFVNEVRITHATYLLAEKDLSVSEISFQCGFGNLSYFNRQFKVVTGKTPFNYRKELFN